jgi:hypothetical protein
MGLFFSFVSLDTWPLYVVRADTNARSLGKLRRYRQLLVVSNQNNSQILYGT